MHISQCAVSVAPFSANNTHHGHGFLIPHLSCSLQ